MRSLLIVYSIEVEGDTDNETGSKGKQKKAAELWYARVIGFQGDSAVVDEDIINAEGYEEELICVVIRWFYQAKEVKRWMSSQPKSDARDHLLAALSDDQHLAGTEEQTISWQTVTRTRCSFTAGAWVDPGLQEQWLMSMCLACAIAGARICFGIDGNMGPRPRRLWCVFTVQ